MHRNTSKLYSHRFLSLALPGLFIAAIGLYSTEAAAFAKCRQPDGTVLYQNVPCGTSERGERQASEAGNPYAAPASQDSDVIHTLLGIKSSLDPLQTALSVYQQERGYFPGNQEVLKPADAGRPFGKNSIWSELGYSVNPSLPYGVASLTYVPLQKNRDGGATSFALVVAMTNVEPTSIDGTLLGVSPSSDVVIRSATKARSRRGKVSGNGEVTYYYSCHHLSGKPLHPAMAQVFSNPNGKPIVCK